MHYTLLFLFCQYTNAALYLTHMKKVIFGIFAHPDDEAFGPCGTLIQEVKNGSDVHLLLLTYGDAGQNPDNVPDLAAVREREWREAGAAIGATSLRGLGYSDGHLDNIAMQTIATEVEPLVASTIAQYEMPISVEFITLEPNGLTGHIDHIVAARMASFVFYRLKSTGAPLSSIRFYCNSETTAPIHTTDWIYADKGHPEHEIDETIDARHLREQILAVMGCHTTQRADCEHYQTLQGDRLGVDHFIVKQ